MSNVLQVFLSNVGNRKKNYAGWIVCLSGMIPDVYVFCVFADVLNSFSPTRMLAHFLFGSARVDLDTHCLSG